jgi:hypothetical protein
MIHNNYQQGKRIDAFRADTGYGRVRIVIAA